MKTLFSGKVILILFMIIMLIINILLIYNNIIMTVLKIGTALKSLAFYLILEKEEQIKPRANIRKKIK